MTVGVRRESMGTMRSSVEWEHRLGEEEAWEARLTQEVMAKSKSLE